jgi:hypothetical protein
MCQQQVSPNAITCPGCGDPMPAFTPGDMQVIRKDARYRSFVWCCGIVFFGAIYAMYTSLLDSASCFYFMGASGGLYVVGEIVRNINVIRERNISRMRKR